MLRTYGYHSESSGKTFKSGMFLPILQKWKHVSDYSPDTPQNRVGSQTQASLTIHTCYFWLYRRPYYWAVSTNSQPEMHMMGSTARTCKTIHSSIPALNVLLPFFTIYSFCCHTQESIWSSFPLFLVTLCLLSPPCFVQPKWNIVIVESSEGYMVFIF